MKQILESIRLKIKDLLFPGIDFCLRKRLKLVKKYLKAGPIKTLDVGCGNGAFCFLCYKLGNSVIGIDLNPDNIKRCLEYRDYKGVPASRVKFTVFNIYNLLELNETFEQIICFETLEHLIKDKYTLELFAKLLNPGGLLHLGVPNLNCPYYYGEKISLVENGLHVRKGYTYSTLRETLMGLGLEVVKEDKYGGLFTLSVTSLLRRLQVFCSFVKCSKLIKEITNVLAFLVLVPLTYLDIFSKREPISIYIMAKKPPRRILASYEI